MREAGLVGGRRFSVTVTVAVVVTVGRGVIRCTFTLIGVAIGIGDLVV